MKEMVFSIDHTAQPIELPHTWSCCVGAGRACEGLRAGWQAQLRKAVQECGFRYIRFHGLLSDDMFVYAQTENGPLIASSTSMSCSMPFCASASAR